MRLLLVDDSLAIRKRLVELCNEIPTIEVVATSANASEAIAALYVYRPELLVLDIQLGGPNAFDLLKALGHRFPDMHVLLITAGDVELYRMKAEALGIHYLFDKTADMPLLRSTLAELSVSKPPAS